MEKVPNAVNITYGDDGIPHFEFCSASAATHDAPRASRAALPPDGMQRPDRGAVP